MRFSDPKSQIEIELTLYGCDWQTEEEITEMRKALEAIILKNIEPIFIRQLERRKKQGSD